MANWAQMELKDASSPMMEELMYFHDYTLMMLSFMTILVLYGILSLSYSSLTKLFFTEKQTMETIWTMMPAMMLMFMAFPSLQMLYLMDEIKSPFLTMKAMGHQWYWSYEYTDYKNIEFDSYMIPEEDLKTGNPRLLEVDKRLILPYNKPMRMLVSSTDVLHSWAIPTLSIKMDAVPGRLKQTSMYLNRTGMFYGQCSEICGAKHSFMPMVMESVPFKMFNKWMKKKTE